MLYRLTYGVADGIKGHRVLKECVEAESVDKAVMKFFEAVSDNEKQCVCVMGERTLLCIDEKNDDILRIYVVLYSEVPTEYVA